MRIFISSLSFCLLAACASTGDIIASQDDVSEPDEANAEREFTTGYAGSRPQDEKLLAGTYFDDPQIRELIYKLEKGPLSRAKIEEALLQTGISLDDLLRVKVLSERNGRIYIGLNYFTSKDMQAIYEAAEKYVPKLVEEYIRNKPAFDDVFAAYDPEGVSKDDLAFILIAGFSLNWDGLKALEEAGYRRPNLVEGDFENGGHWKYSYFAAETVEDYSTKGFFWGSSTFPAGPFNFDEDPVDFSFSSYGDPYSDPRMNFPDLFYLPTDAMSDEVAALARDAGLRNETMFGASFDDVFGLERARSIGAILFALRDGPKDEDALRAITPSWDRDSAGALLSLLEEIDYVEKVSDGTWRLCAVVLDEEDAAMVDAALELSRMAIEAWAEKNMPDIQKDLRDLTALRHGVAFESLMTQIWHDFFGLTTKRLVEAEFFADPYGEDVKYKGSLGALWRASLYDFDPQ